jgi:hypothetical protein
MAMPAVAARKHRLKRILAVERWREMGTGLGLGFFSAKGMAGADGQRLGYMDVPMCQYTMAATGSQKSQSGRRGQPHWQLLPSGSG